MIQGYTCCRVGCKIYVTSQSGNIKEFGVIIDATDTNVENFMDSLTEGQLKDMFKEKK